MKENNLKFLFLDDKPNYLSNYDVRYYDEIFVALEWDLLDCKPQKYELKWH